MPISLAELAIALVATMLGAVVQGTIGVGFAVLSVPILSLVNPILAPVPQLLLAVPLALSMTWRERTHIEARTVGWLLSGRIPGAAMGLVLLALATQRSLDIGIAVSVLVAVGILGAGLTVPRSPVTDFSTGVIAGIMGMVASMGGPPAALLLKDGKGPAVRSSLALFFSVGLAVTVVLRLVTGRISSDDVTISLLLLPAMLLGYIISSRLRDRIDGTTLRPAILTISTVAAVGLLIRAFG
ncbi:MAG: sulfite exporter TauE/SafE family protein [bacterium]|nr:sulfite exporter TauE/SafE family protein [bacterium]MCP4968203.1 sulfite exporter TauE/SafE family protein [bacterium]